MPAPPTRPTCTAEMLAQVLEGVKKRVGTTRSAPFNASIVHIAATGHSVKGWAGDVCSADTRRRGGADKQNVPQNVPEELVYFLRGVRVAQMHLVTTLRRDVHALLGTEGVRFFDATLQEHPLVEHPLVEPPATARTQDADPPPDPQTAPQSGDRSPLHPQPSRAYTMLAEHMAKRLRHALTTGVHHHFAVPLFHAVFDAMDKALHHSPANAQVADDADLPIALAAKQSNKHIAEDNYASFVFAHTASLQVADVLARLHPTPHGADTSPAHPEAAPQTTPQLQDRLCELAERSAELITRTAHGGFTPEGVRGFLRHVAADDAPRKDPSVLQLVEQIDRLDRQLTDTTGHTAEGLSALREERNETLRLLTAFCSGALHTLYVVLLGNCKPALSSALQAGRAFYETVQESTTAPCSIRPLFRRLVCHRLEESMRTTLLQLVADLQLEGAIKSFGESNFSLTCDDTVATLQLEFLLKRHRILSGCVRTLLRMNPALIDPLLACVRVAQPLAFAIARSHHSDPREAARIAADTHLARLLGVLIHMDSGFKNLLVNVPAFFDLLRKEGHNRELLHWLRAVSSGPSKARAQLLAEPRVLLALWHLHAHYAHTELTAYLLRKPLDLTHFIQLDSHKPDAPALQEFLHEVQRRPDGPQGPQGPQETKKPTASKP